MNQKEIKEDGILAKGKKELLDHMNGKQLTAYEAIIGKCYECTNGYADGKVDCGIKDCPLYGFMPYRKGAPLVRRKMTDEQKKNIGKKATENEPDISLDEHNNA